VERIAKSIMRGTGALNDREPGEGSDKEGVQLEKTNRIGRYSRGQKSERVRF